MMVHISLINYRMKLTTSKTLYGMTALILVNIMGLLRYTIDLISCLRWVPLFAPNEFSKQTYVI